MRDRTRGCLARISARQIVLEESQRVTRVNHCIVSRVGELKSLSTVEVSGCKSVCVPAESDLHIRTSAQIRGARHARIEPQFVIRRGVEAFIARPVLEVD